MRLPDLKREVLDRFAHSAFDSDPIRADVHDITHGGVDAVRRTFQGKSWPDVNLTLDITNIGYSIIFLTFDAYCYYFPCFLTQLTNALLIDSSLNESFIDHLSPKNIDEKTLDFYLALGQHKQVIVAQFLVHAWNHFDDISALDALEDFWDTFLTSEEKKAVYESPEAIRIKTIRLQVTAANKRR